MFVKGCYSIQHRGHVIGGPAITVTGFSGSDMKLIVRDGLGWRALISQRFLQCTAGEEHQSKHPGCCTAGGEKQTGQIGLEHPSEFGKS